MATVSYYFGRYGDKVVYTMGVADNCELIYDEDGIKTYRKCDQLGGCIFSIITIEGKNYFHHPFRPSWSQMNRNGIWEHEFYIKGIKHNIENLPCDDEVKVYLKLKYTHKQNAIYEGGINDY